MYPHIDAIGPTATLFRSFRFPPNPAYWPAVSMLVAATSLASAADVAAPTQKQASSRARTAAHVNVLSELKKLAQITHRPAAVSITDLSRQFAFNYRVGPCEKVETSDDWCRYVPQYHGQRPAEFNLIVIGRDRRTGLPVGKLSWEVVDPRVCVRADEVQPLLGAGERDWGIIREYFGSTPEKPLPVITDYVHRAIPGGVVNARTAFKNQCLLSVDINFLSYQQRR